MNNNFFEVLRPGINTTFQDQGRFNLQHFGVAPSGCMDYKSFSVANALLSNDKTEGVLEFAYQGPLLKLIKGQTKFAITGNVHFQIINSKNKTVTGECNRTYDLEEGEQVDILATNKTVYGYFAVEGGFSVSPFCNSVSTLSRANIGPNEGKKINVKNKIFFKKNRQEKNNYIIRVPDKNNNLIRVLRGPQYDYFSDTSKKEKQIEPSSRIRKILYLIGKELPLSLSKYGVFTTLKRIYRLGMRVTYNPFLLRKYYKDSFKAEKTF